MKKMILLFIGVFPMLCFAQERTFDKGALIYSGIVECPDMTASKVYAIVKTYISESYKSAKAVTSTDIQEEGLIVIDGILNGVGYDNGIMGRYEDNLYHKIKFQIKDNKFKYTISEIVYGQKFKMPVGYYLDEKGVPKRFTKKIYDGIEAGVNSIIESIKSAPNSYSKSKEW